MKHGTLGHRESDKLGLSERVGVLGREAPTSTRQCRWWEYVTKGENAQARELIDQALAIHPEDPDMYLTRFWCVVTDMWNDDTFVMSDLEPQYDGLKEMIDKAEMYGADPGDIEFVRGRLEMFRTIVLGRSE